MDTDILVDYKDSFYDEDFLQELTKEYSWSSLLDVADASPTEILADAAPVLVPAISPVLSIKSSPTESSTSDSGSEDDIKNSISSSPQCDPSGLDFDNEPPQTLRPEDVDLFLQKLDPVLTAPPCGSSPKIGLPERNCPVMAIENGVIKGIKVEKDNKKMPTKVFSLVQGNGQMQNHYFKVVNENDTINNPKITEKQNVLRTDRRKMPCILKRSSNISNILLSEVPSIVIPPDVKDGKIEISPLCPSKNYNIDVATHQAKTSPPRNTVHMISKLEAIRHEVPSEQIDVSMDSDEYKHPNIDLSQLSDAEIRAFKKQQRMIKNRESACQSRQKKRDYVKALEQQLLEAHQEIAKLRLENKILRDELQSNGKRRKIRIDASSILPKKNFALIFAMVFMVTLNWNIFGWNNKPFVGPASSHTSTRHLLWSEDNKDVVSPDYDQYIDRGLDGVDCQNITLNANDLVKINQNESMRIAGELKRWIGGGKTLNWTYAPKKSRKRFLSEEEIKGGLLDTYKLFGKLNLGDNLIDIPSINKHQKPMKEKSRLRRLKKSSAIKNMAFPDSAVYYERLYHKPIRKSVNDLDMDDIGEWNALLQALHRRDDTFYVVGVGKGEHLLLPAVSHNITRPPKMALILPARSGNDSLMNDHVTLMQIDCSVVNTTLVKLKSEALPESLRKTTDDNAQISVLDSPKPKRESESNNDTIDAGLTGIMQSTSNNVTNSVSYSKQGKGSNSSDISKFPYVPYPSTKPDKTIQPQDLLRYIDKPNAINLRAIKSTGSN